MAGPSVLITTEGTYPFYGGGVSVWCDQLVRNLPEVRFDVLALVHSLSQPPRFHLPGNIRSLTPVALWGSPEAGLRETDVTASFRRRGRTGARVIETVFIPNFQIVLEGILGDSVPSSGLGEAFHELALYSRDFDYAASFSSPQAWRVFLDCCAFHGLELTLREASDALRWLQRYLSVLTVEVPRTDIVHATMAGLAGLPAVLGKIANGSVYILSEHGLHMREMYATLNSNGYSHRSRDFLARFHRAITRLNYASADLITSLGPYNRDWQIRLGAQREKIAIVPNGVDADQFYPRPASPRTRPTVLTMARIFPLKGIEPLVRAAAIVRDRIPNVLFRILGDVADHDYYNRCLRVIAAERLEDNISFGVTRTSHLAYREADVYCSPSLSEGMPYAVLEAMMSGLPVVATEVGNMRDILNNTGLLVRPNNPAELAAALMEMLAGHGAPEFREFLAGAALKRAREQFTLDACIGSFRRVYEELYDERSVATLSRHIR